MMSLTNTVISLYLKRNLNRVELYKKYPDESQFKTFNFLIKKALKTEFGKEFGFDDWKEDIEKFIAFLQNTVLPEFYAEHSKALQIFNNNEIYLLVCNEFGYNRR